MPRSYEWEITPEKVEMAIQRIIEVGHPLKLILFGSYVRGETTINSDLDILVVMRNDIINQRQESVRIRRALRGISMPMDIIVVPEEKWIQLKDEPGLIYRQALREGKVVYESSNSI
ncbi:MAG: nucleotidyltransferase domain-containing protein [bacterium]